MLIESTIIFVLLLYSHLIKCDTDSNHSNPRDDEDYYIKDNKDERKLRWMSLTADYWKNHRNPYYNYLLAKNRESKSNNEAYFAEPAVERYEQSPSALQITAIPANGYAAAPSNGYEYSYGGYGPDPGPRFPGEPLGWGAQQKFPVFVINKSGGKAESFKWMIPLLLLLGLPLLCGLIFIPILLQTAFFFLAIFRNLGFLLPLLTGMAGNGLNGINGMNPVIPATG